MASIIDPEKPSDPSDFRGGLAGVVDGAPMGIGWYPSRSVDGAR